MNEISKKGYTNRHRITDYGATFSGDHGERVLNDLIFRHDILESAFSSDPLAMAYKEGQRDVVLGILQFMQMKPDEIPQRRVSVLEQFALEDDDGIPSNR